MLGDDSRTRTPEGVFGAELRYYRERARLSQTEMAALVNISHDVISKIETGERPPARDFPERLDAVPQLDTRTSSPSCGLQPDAGVTGEARRAWAAGSRDLKSRRLCSPR